MIIDTHAEHTTFGPSLAAKAINELRAARGADEIDHTALVRYLQPKATISKRTIRDLAGRPWSKLPKALRG